MSCCMHASISVTRRAREVSGFFLVIIYLYIYTTTTTTHFTHIHEHTQIGYERMCEAIYSACCFHYARSRSHSLVRLLFRSTSNNANCTLSSISQLIIIYNLHILVSIYFYYFT